ncbi:hypothetical protein KR018_010663 [Drosophila ironensis]|nr:hypothetical protein KR018_010663 [Drosophila ironensis]
MKLTRGIAAISLLLVILAQVGSEENQLDFLKKFISSIKSKSRIESLFILQHEKAENCSLRNLNIPDLPTVRYDNRGKLEFRRNFNRFALGLVCICRESDVDLLEDLASDFDRMRQKRIILWMQTRITNETVARILKSAEDYQFTQMMILRMNSQRDLPSLVLRLHPFPTAHFRRVKNITDIQGLDFKRFEWDFKGKTFNIMPSSHKVLRMQDSEFSLFALRHNISWREMKTPRNGILDVKLNTVVGSRKASLRNLNPYDMSSIMVVVPCGRERTILEVLRQLDFRTSLIYLLPVYVTFVAVETIILIVTHRTGNRTGRINYFGPLLNFRAFRAVLGSSFPMGQPPTLSLRLLFLAISVFGLIYSSFFGCKLSALLTKHPSQPQVRNFDELRASGLEIIGGPLIRKFVETEMGEDFFTQNLSNFRMVTQAERLQKLLSLDDNYAYVMSSESWGIFNHYQMFMGRSFFCTSKDLIIVQALPMLYVLRDNSVLNLALSRFLHRVHETGIKKHWLNMSPHNLKRLLNETIKQETSNMPYPLSLNHFKWLWCVLGCGYGLAVLVFIIEFLLSRFEERNARPKLQVFIV